MLLNRNNIIINSLHIKLSINNCNTKHTQSVSATHSYVRMYSNGGSE